MFDWPYDECGTRYSMSMLFVFVCFMYIPHRLEIGSGGSEDTALLLLPRATKYDDLDQALLFCQRRIQYRSIDCEQLSAGST